MVVVQTAVVSWVLLACTALPYRGSHISSFSYTQRPANFASGWAQQGGYYHGYSGPPNKGSWGSSPPRPGGFSFGINNGGWKTQSSPASSSDTVNRFGNQPPIQNSVAAGSECRAGGKVYQVGDKWTPEGGCGRNTCAEGGKTTVLGCPKAEPTDKCTMTAEDPRQPWPFCCPQLRCPE